MRIRLVGMAALLVLGGCSSSHEAGGGDGGTGEECGPVTCDEGTVCCNASCGICAEPGLDCPAIACVDSSMPTACGGRLGDTCAADEYCDFAYDGCGFDDGTGTCRPRPAGCDDDCPQVCGCDGETYCNACNAAESGTDIQHEGPCDPPAGCEAMDAEGEGDCLALLGWKWDGERCVNVGGCDCVGEDCDSLYDDEEACVADREACIDDCRVEGCPDGQWCGACRTGGGEIVYVCLREGSVC